MIHRRDKELAVQGTEIFLDSRQPRPLSFVSHGHSDHICVHRRAIATPATLRFCKHRLSDDATDAVRLDYDQPFDLDADTRLHLTPAGHVYGSAMLHLTRPEGTLLYTGDFRLRDDSLTVEAARPEPADVVLMETTYGLPQFKFPPRSLVHEQLVDAVAQAFTDNKQPIVFGYSLGKGQEITRILNDAGFVVTAHGAVQSMTQIHQELGVNVGTSRRYAVDDFHGPAALDLRERGVLLAPPHTTRSGFIKRFDNACKIMMTGWALTKGAIYRYGVDHALPLSDHADFDELLELIEIVRPKKIFTHHGYPAFAEMLRQKGLDASVAEEHPQLELFSS